MANLLEMAAFEKSYHSVDPCHLLSRQNKSAAAQNITFRHPSTPVDEPDPKQLDDHRTG
jgi:hypothetical protein